MVASPPGWGPVASGFLGGAPGLHRGSLPQRPDLPATRTRSAGKRDPARRLRRAEAQINGVRGGTKLPLALLSQRRLGWPRPREGRPGGLTTRSVPPAPLPRLGAAVSGPSRDHGFLAHPAPASKLPGWLRGSVLGPDPNTLALGTGPSKPFQKPLGRSRQQGGGVGLHN